MEGQAAWWTEEAARELKTLNACNQNVWLLYNQHLWG
jgi:hypothetical protein